MDRATDAGDRAERPEAILFCGIQACGKTSFYSERFLHTHVRISLDLVGTRARETALLELCLEEGQSFVVDKVNATAAERARYIEPAREAGFHVRGYYFPAGPSVALERNMARPPAARIPVAAIRSTALRLEMPALHEGFDELCYVTCTASGEFRADPVAVIPRFAASAAARI